jgi:CHAT domain
VKKILILSANPNSTERLRLDVEVREIQKAVKARRDQLEVVAEWAVGVDNLHSALLDHQPNIVHFSGHGARSSGLVLENYSGQKQFVTTESLAELFELFNSTVECVLLNACHSIEQAEAISQHIEYVIGMNKEIQDTVAIKFSNAFYNALGAGENYENAYKLGCNAIKLNGLIADASTPILKVNPRIINKQLLPMEKEKKPLPQSNSGITVNISGTQMSGGFVLVQGENNQISMETNSAASNNVENKLTQQEIVEMLAAIEQFVEATQELPEKLKRQSLKYLERAKDELQSAEPDKQFAASDLKQMAKALAPTKVWDSVEPILMQLPAWLDVPRSYFHE